MTTRIADMPTRKPDAAEPTPSLRMQASSVIDPSVEQSVGVTLQELTELYILESIKGFGPQEFKDLHGLGIRPSQLLADPLSVKSDGKCWDDFRVCLRSMPRGAWEKCRERASRQILVAYKCKSVLLTYYHTAWGLGS